MASAQYEMMTEEIAEQLSLEEKESLDETIKEAESDLESLEVQDQSLAIVAKNEGLDKKAKLTIYIVAGAAKNLTKGPLSVMATNIWAGHMIRNFPNPLKSFGTFVISNTSDKGVKAAVVYSGNNKNKLPCAWLLAFVDNKDNGMRIYGECGRKSNFIHIDWKRVEHKLLQAGKVVNFRDHTTGTSLCAAIQGKGGKAAVAVGFRG